MSKSSNLRLLCKRKVDCAGIKLEKELSPEQTLKQEFEKAEIEHLLFCFEREKQLRKNPNLSRSTMHLMMALINGID